jgi:hypothetical protein
VLETENCHRPLTLKLVKVSIALVIGATVLIGCSVAGDLSPTSSPTTSVPEATPREVISLSISLFLLVDDEDEPNPTISTHRSKEDLREILEGMNDIWSQADIRLELQTIEFVEVPDVILQGMLAGNLGPFFNEIGDGITLPQVSTINGFYLRGVGGPNGTNPFRSRTFFVIDEPSVFDRRVSSHEVGHILGLHHVLGDSDRLLFSGTNGMTLTEEEAAVARYIAQGINQGVR